MDDCWTAWEDLNTSMASIERTKTDNVAADLRPYQQSWPMYGLTDDILSGLKIWI